MSMSDYMSNHVVIRPLADFPGYWADNFGVIYTSKHQVVRKSGGNGGGFKNDGELKPLKPWLAGPKTHRYETVTLWNGWNKNRGKKRKVHQLILETFVGPKPDGMEACHGDGNIRNNRLDNLRWDTHANNMKDRITHGTSCSGDKHWSRIRMAAR